MPAYDDAADTSVSKWEEAADWMVAAP